MWSSAYRDEPLVPALLEPMDAFRAWLDEVAENLTAALTPARRARADCRMTVRHAIAVTTWADFADRLDDRRYASLMQRWIAGAST